MSVTLSPLKAIRAKCIDCCGGSKSYIATCGIPDCPLYPYRLGKNPNRKGTRELSDEQKQPIEIVIINDDIQKIEDNAFKGFKNLNMVVFNYLNH